MWELVGVVIGMMWGVGYTVIRPSGLEHSPFILNIYYGVIYIVCNVIGSAVNNDMQNTDSWIWSKTQCLYFIVYAAVMTGATMLYNVAAMKPEVSISVLTALTCCYPIITWIGSMIFFSQLFLWKHLLGAVCIVAGAAIMSIQ